ncbi:MAG: CHAT domain-containing protein [Xenococcaceae cyanobacterium]
MVEHEDIWIEAALNLTSSGLADLLKKLPPSRMQKLAIEAASGNNLQMRVYGLTLVSQDHAVGGDPQIGLFLAKLGMRLCMQCFERQGSGPADTFVFGVSQFALNANRSWHRLDEHQQQLAVIDDTLAWLSQRKAKAVYSKDLKFARVGVLIELDRPEEAYEALNDARNEFDRTRQELDKEDRETLKKHFLDPILDERISERLLPATKLKDRDDTNKKANDSQRNMLRTVLGNLSSIESKFENLFESLQQQLSNEPTPVSPTETIKQANLSYDRISQFLEGQAGGSGPEYRLKSTIQRVSAVLADEQQGHDLQTLRESQQTLESVRKEAGSQQFSDIVEQTLWPLYLCYKRLGKRKSGFEVLQEIRRCVRERRKQILDPLKRAYVAQQYPYLYFALCEYLIQDDNPTELLSVIEEAKGRVLADMVESHAAQAQIPTLPGQAADWLPDHMKSLGAHYVTFLVDADKTYAVLLGRDASIHMAELPIGEAQLHRLRHCLDPSLWGKRIDWFDTYPTDVVQQLSPLTSWLQPMVHSGLLRQGDHICYAPDGILHLVPLHYVDFCGKPLIEMFSLSRTHCALLLWESTREPVRSLDHSVAVKVPTIDEFKEQPEKVAKLALAPKWLAEHRRAEILEDTNADLSALANMTLSSSIIHFATHGTFTPGQNPFYHSGLLLAINGEFPNKNGSRELLSPERVMEQGNKFNFRGSHVTLQACVSGLSEEGAGGDALGLEWSLLIAGASSILSSHWDVSVHASSDFSVRFYENWLEQGMSRASAWRNACLSLMSDDPFQGENVDKWAAFSLAGDWR